jgi:trigger factor
MPKVAREDIDALNAVLTVTIPKEEYEPKFKKELNKIKDKAAIKGFRKGKTPTGFLKKMYGKSVLSEIVTEILQHELSEVMASEEISYLGKPIPTDDQPPVDFDLNNFEDYVFKFDLGKAPEFEVKGMDSGTEFEIFKVDIPADKVEERLEYIRKRRGERFETEEMIEEEDMISLNAVELDGDAPKEDGWKTTFSILVNRIAEGPVKDEILKKKKGDTVRFNVYELEQGTSPEQVKKYLLNFTQTDIDEGTETGEMYEAVIETVSRLKPAELNQELFDQVFGEGEVTSEEDARKKLAENMGLSFQGQADSLLFRDMRKRLIELNKDSMPLPDDFIKRWLKVGHEKEADKILGDYDNFADDMRWSLIKNKLYKQYDFNVEENELHELAYNRVAGYFGGYYQQDMLEPIVKRMMEDPEQLNSLASDLLTDKLFRKFKETVTLKDVSISESDFTEKYQAVMDAEEKAAKLRSADSASEEEE